MKNAKHTLAGSQTQIHAQTHLDIQPYRKGYKRYIKRGFFKKDKSFCTLSFTSIHLSFHDHLPNKFLELALTHKNPLFSAAFLAAPDASIDDCLTRPCKGAAPPPLPPEVCVPESPPGRGTCAPTMLPSVLRHSLMNATTSLISEPLFNTGTGCLSTVIGRLTMANEEKKEGKKKKKKKYGEISTSVIKDVSEQGGRKKKTLNSNYSWTMLSG